MRCAQCLKEYTEKDMITQLGTKYCINCIRKNKKAVGIILGILGGLLLLYIFSMLLFW